MARYATPLTRSSASTSLAMGIIQATLTLPRRITVYDIVVGSEAAPADNPFLWEVARITAQGALAGGTAVTPQPLDVADAAAVFDALDDNITTNPTISATPLLAIPLNQRATFRWVAAPGSELVTPATDNLGLAWSTPTSTALAITATVLAIE